MRDAWAVDTARKIGITGAVDFTVTRVGQTLHIPCQRGKHVADFKIAPGLAPEGVAKRMLSAGWTIGRNPTCPEHRRGSRSKPSPQVTTEREPVMPEFEAKEDVKASDAARRAHRMVMQFLEDYYDETAKRYKPGWTDDRISKETGAASTHVAKTREEYFGPSGAPVELDEIKEAIEILNGDAAAAVSDIQARIKAVEQKLERICTANGWTV